jgi:site-specific DNA-methyltransferase (adenine-specific)
MKKVYTFVPIQDFEKEWTDQQLYAKYKLSQDEIEFIEKMIKPM